MADPIGIVNIYYDPITECQIEDKALLIQKLSDLGDGLELWSVKFMRDDYVTERIIKIK